MAFSRMYLVTGGAGFLGSALVRRLSQEGHRVRVLDNFARGSAARVRALPGVECVEADVRDAPAVAEAARGVDAVCHLAFINGTEFFYTKPGLVLDVGVNGMLSVLEACRRHAVPELLLLSSSEVYQLAATIPTPEEVPLCIPDPHNPRYSYAAGKLISEMLALHAAPESLARVVIVRPHNVYGPAMGWEHVIPQFILRMREAVRTPGDPVEFPVRGTGQETRAFVYVDDFVDGLRLVMDRGASREIYHLGATEERSIESVAQAVGRWFGRRVAVVPSDPAPGSASRRCPDITKARRLGFEPRVRFEDGLALTAQWYDQHADEGPGAPVLRPWVPTGASTP